MPKAKCYNRPCHAYPKDPHIGGGGTDEARGEQTLDLGKPMRTMGHDENGQTR